MSEAWVNVQVRSGGGNCSIDQPCDHTLDLLPRRARRLFASTPRDGVGPGRPGVRCWRGHSALCVCTRVVPQ